MPLDGVFVEPVARSQVKAAAEPPSRRSVPAVGEKGPDVEVSRRSERVHRVEDDGNPHRLERKTGEFRMPDRGGVRKALARDARIIHAAPVDDVSALNHPGSSAAARGPLPSVLAERVAGLPRDDLPAQVVLNPEKGCGHAVGIGCRADHRISRRAGRFSAARAGIGGLERNPLSEAFRQLRPRGENRDRGRGTGIG